MKCLAAVQKTQVQSLGQEDPLEKEMATHSNTLAMDRGVWWVTVHGQRSLVGYSPWGHKELDTKLLTFTFHMMENNFKNNVCVYV